MAEAAVAFGVFLYLAAAVCVFVTLGSKFHEKYGAINWVHLSTAALISLAWPVTLPLARWVL